MANIELTPLSTVNTTNIYEISGATFVSGNNYYIEINDTVKWIAGAFANANCFGNIKASLEDTTNLYLIQSLPSPSFPLVFFNCTRVWFTDLQLPTNGTITIELKQIP